MRKFQIPLILFFCAMLFSCQKAAPPTVNNPPQAVKAAIQEGYPVTLIQALEERQRQLESASAGIRAGLRSIMSISRSWKPGAVITVAFKGGSKELRRQLIAAIKPWADVANISFDFGDLASTSNYREWTTDDSSYRANIRIAFDSQPEGGYWSSVGTDSINKFLRTPNKASMNLQGFSDELPQEWQSIVLHEFGHALGFEHEHQSPASSCEQEYRWVDDPGYTPTQDMYHQFVPDSHGRQPGIYTVLGGAPNWWPPSQVDFNMKKFANTTDLIFSSFDPASIMKYRFDARLYRNISTSTSSGCYSVASLTLSVEDQRAASARYPRSPADIQTIAAERSKVASEVLRKPGLPADLRTQFRAIFVGR